jgi:hypothetical protein
MKEYSQMTQYELLYKLYKEDKLISDEEMRSMLSAIFAGNGKVVVLKNPS